MLWSLLELEGPVAKISSSLRSLLKKKSEIFEVVKEALKELEMLRTALEAADFSLPVSVCLNLIYSPWNYDSIIFRVEAVRQKFGQKFSRTVTETLAAGGRYDSLISRFETLRDPKPPPNGRTAFGVCFSVDVLMAEVAREEKAETETDIFAREAIVCCIGQKSMANEILNFSKRLWELEIATE